MLAFKCIFKRLNRVTKPLRTTRLSTLRIRDLEKPQTCKQRRICATKPIYSVRLVASHDPRALLALGSSGPMHTITSNSAVSGVASKTEHHGTSPADFAAGRRASASGNTLAHDLRVLPRSHSTFAAAHLT